MIAKILEYIQKQIKDAYFLIGAFVFIWLVAWLANGLIGTHLDINALTNFFFGIVGKFGFDSIFNSDKGVKP